VHFWVSFLAFTKPKKNLNKILNKTLVLTDLNAMAPDYEPCKLINMLDDT
jgi:hypothetical protein